MQGKIVPETFPRALATRRACSERWLAVGRVLTTVRLGAGLPAVRSSPARAASMDHWIRDYGSEVEGPVRLRGRARGSSPLPSKSVMIFWKNHASLGKT